MLQITVPAIEVWDERKEEFVIAKKEQSRLYCWSILSFLFQNGSQNGANPFFRRAKRPTRKLSTTLNV